MIVAGEDQVDAGSLEIAGEKKMSVGNDDRVRRRVRCVMRNRLDSGLPLQMQAQGIGREIRVEFTGVIQIATAKS